MTQYKVDVIGETCCDKNFDSIEESFDHLKHLLKDGKKVEICILPEVPVEAPTEGEGAPTSTETDTAPAADTEDTENTDEPVTDPKDADIDATDEPEFDADGNELLTGEEIDDGAKDEPDGI